MDKGNLEIAHAIQSPLPKSEALVEMLSSRVTSIGEVIDRLSAILQWALANDSRLGYFPALYRKVTVSVQNGIQQDAFDDGKRMEQLDIIFASRYLDAFRTWCTGRLPTQSWRLAFESTSEYWPIVLQHLLLGINAHINLDLGIAAAETMRNANLEDVHGDFNKINAVLTSLVDDVQTELAEVWMTLRLMNRFLGNIDDAIVNFSMKKARDEAWRSAQTFRALPETAWPEAIARQDKQTLIIGTLVRHPGRFLSTVTGIVRVGELRSPRRVIEILS